MHPNPNLGFAQQYFMTAYLNIRIAPKFEASFSLLERQREGTGQVSLKPGCSQQPLCWWILSMAFFQGCSASYSLGMEKRNDDG